ncbi:MAG: hypothetical protein M3436_00905 [Pseudomonadota bacterium]|nr:hypothetical protein [Pseudomonadota bacterium]
MKAIYVLIVIAAAGVAEGAGVFERVYPSDPFVDGWKAGLVSGIAQGRQMCLTLAAWPEQ